MGVLLGSEAIYVGVTELLSCAAKYAAVFVFIANSSSCVNVLVYPHA